MNPWLSWGGWAFPLLCLLVMAVMMFACRDMPFGYGHRSHGTEGGETPRQILERRYASGQLTKEQYDTMRLDLEA